MFSKIKKIFIVLSVSILSVNYIAPAVVSTSVHAQVNTRTHYQSDKNTKISRTQFDYLVNEGVRNYNIKYEEAQKIIYKIYKNNIDFIFIETRAPFWTEKGLTVEGAAFVIDSALGTILGSAFKNVLRDMYISNNSTQLARVGRLLRQKLIESGYSGFAAMVGGLISFFSFILEPGMTLARMWDARDAYPNNGHINF